MLLYSAPDLTTLRVIEILKKCSFFIQIQGTILSPLKRVLFHNLYFLIKLFPNKSACISVLTTMCFILIIFLQEF
jgi:hypothetical protein